MQCEVKTWSTNLNRSFANANQTWQKRSGILFCVDDGMHQGIGEASPLPGYSPDTLEDCEVVLRELKVPNKVNTIEAVQAFVSSLPENLPAARFAVETALLDRLGRATSQSISQLLFPAVCSRKKVPSCGLLDPAKPVESARSLVQRGLKTAKLKVGRNWSKSLQTIRTICQTAPDLALRLDANASWSIQETVTRLQDIASLPIQFVEQPVVPKDMQELPPTAVAIAADESLRPTWGTSNLPIANPSFCAVVLKPTVLGGLLACMDLARWGKERNLHCIASHCLEGPVATAATAELAVALSDTWAQGVDLHPGLLPEHHTKIPQLAGGFIRPHIPGLGTRP